MILTTRFFYLDGRQPDKQFILSSAFVRQFDEFKINIQLLKIRTQDYTIFEKLKSHCESNSTRISLLNKVDTIIHTQCYISYFDLENILPNLKNQLSTFYQQQYDVHSIQYFSFADSNNDVYKFPMKILHCKRLYMDLESFYANYLILDGMYRLIINSNSSNKINNISDKEVNEEIKTHKQNINSITNLQTNQESNQVINNDKITLCDSILYLSINQSIVTSLIYYTFTYYQYHLNNTFHIKLDYETNKMILTIPNILPTYYIFNKFMFKNIILSNTDISLDQLNIYYNKILVNLHNKDYNENAMYGMMLCYLLLVYSLIYVYKLNTQYLISEFDNVLSNVELQTKIINHVIQLYFKDFAQKFVIRIVNYDVLDKNDISSFEEDIKHIGKKYTHLIPIDQQKFIDCVFTDLQKTPDKESLPSDFKINNYKIIDLELLKQQQKSVEDIIFNTQKNITYDLKLLNFNYNNLNSRPITSAYQLLLDYAHDPSVLVIEKNRWLPKTILNLFDTFKNILKPDIFNKSNNDTLSYYKILCSKLPDPSVFCHTTLLFIIYQIIIPYMHDMHKITKFKDCLL